MMLRVLVLLVIACTLVDSRQIIQLRQKYKSSICQTRLPSQSEWQGVTKSMNLKKRGSTHKEVTNIDALLPTGTTASWSALSNSMQIRYEIAEFQKKDKQDPDHGQWRRKQFADLLQCTNDLLDAANVAFTSDPVAVMSQVRLYMGGVSTKSSNVGSSLAPANFFSTNLWHKWDHVNNKLESCKHFASVLHNIQLNAVSGKQEQECGGPDLTNNWLPEWEQDTKAYQTSAIIGRDGNMVPTGDRHKNALILNILWSALNAQAPPGPSVTWLGYQSNSCAYTFVDNKDVAAFTTAMSGCDAFVAIDPNGIKPPMFIHCNGDSFRGASATAKEKTASRIVSSYGYQKHKMNRHGDVTVQNSVTQGYDSLQGSFAGKVITYGVNKGSNQWEWYGHFIAKNMPTAAYNYQLKPWV